MLILVVPAFSQDPLSSHFFQQLGNLNPSLAGSSGSQRYFVNYRNQCPGLSSAFVTYTAGFDAPVTFLHGGIGVTISDDVLARGTFNTFTSDLFYSYHFRVSRDWYFKGGLVASFNNKLLRAINLTDDYKTEVIPSRTAYMLDFGAGLSTQYKNFSGGFSCLHMTNTVIAGSEKIKLPLKLSLHALYYIRFNDLNITPSFLIQRQQSAMHMTYGTMLFYKMIGSGIWFRQDESFHFSSLIYAFHVDYLNFSFIYSYDMPFLRLSNWSNFGAHEVTFLMKLKYKSPGKKNRQSIKNPRI